MDRCAFQRFSLETCTRIAVLLSGILLLTAAAPLFAVEEIPDGEGHAIKGEVDFQTTWGEPVGGLQAGLAFANDKSDYLIGETLALHFKIRNTSESDIFLTYMEWGRRGYRVLLFDVVGKDAEDAALLIPRVMGGTVAEVTLKPGEVIEISQPKILIRPATWWGQVSEPVLLAHEKHYTVKCAIWRSRAPGRWDFDGARIASGSLEFTVRSSKGDEAFLEGFTVEQAIEAMTPLGLRERHFVDAMGSGRDDGPSLPDSWYARAKGLSEGALRYLSRVAADFPDEHYRLLACDMLGNTGNVAASDLLVTLLADDIPAMRGKAARALGHLRARSRIPELLPLLKDSDPGVRSSTCYALGHIASDEATESLADVLLGDDDENTRYAAALAIGWITDPAALPSLNKALSDPSKQVKDAAKAAIRNIEDPEYWGLGVKQGKPEPKPQPIESHLTPLP